MIRKFLLLAMFLLIGSAAFAGGTPVWPLDYSGTAQSAAVRVDAVRGRGAGADGTGWTGGPDYSTETGVPPVTDNIIPSPSAVMPLSNKDLVVDDGIRVLSASVPSGFPMDDPQVLEAEFIERKSIFAENPEDGTQALQDVVRDWVAKEGMTLRETLQQWADIEGWELVWNTNREYPLRASAIFRGRFKDVSSAIIRSFSRATPQPMAKYYFGNRVLVIRTLEEHDAN